MIESIKYLLPLATIIGQIIFVIGLLIFITKKPVKLYETIKTNCLALALFFATVALGGSLFYSEIAGYEPCKLCWFQRILMFPQTLILGIAFLKKDLRIYTYGIAMSVVGALISINHYILQLTGSSILPCSAVGQSVSCSKVFVLKFGYITIPLMCFTAFLLIILFLSYAKRNLLESENTSR